MNEHDETVSVGGQHAGPDAGAHSYRIATYGAGLRGFLKFRAICACGWESDPMPTAGLAHAAHDDHAAPTDTDNKE